MANIRIPLPPILEQEAIDTYLRRALKGLTEAEHRIKSEVALVREYRTRLIADVVTGKSDVRKASEDLPSSADRVATEDDTLDYSPFDAEDMDGLHDSPELLSVAADED